MGRRRGGGGRRSGRRSGGGGVGFGAASGLVPSGDAFEVLDSTGGRFNSPRAAREAGFTEGRRISTTSSLNGSVTTYEATGSTRRIGGQYTPVLRQTSGDFLEIQGSRGLRSATALISPALLFLDPGLRINFTN